MAITTPRFVPVAGAKVSKGAKKMWDFYNHTPDAPIHQQEFWLMQDTLDRWTREGHINSDTDLDALFGFDDAGEYKLNCLGWCEAAFFPKFPEIVLEDRGAHELVQDTAGRSVLYFKGKRQGFMPEYVDHPVKTIADFEEKIAFRMDASNEDREKYIADVIAKAKAAQMQGWPLCHNMIGGYMYLRSLLGPEGALYLFYDDPELIHRCMRQWLELADKVSARLQEELEFDHVYLAEDICYKGGALISPSMMRDFLFPYYRELLEGIRARQKKPFLIQIDTDGDCRNVIPLYQEIGMEYMSPFEVASGCDVVAIAKQYPDLLMRGGFDKRILSTTTDAIDAEIDRIMPFMKKRGGFIPSVDHGTPAEVSFENYMHFRKRMLEFAE